MTATPAAIAYRKKRAAAKAAYRARKLAKEIREKNTPWSDAKRGATAIKRAYNLKHGRGRKGGIA